MTELQRELLAACKSECDAEEQSTEYMLQYMRDRTGVGWWEMMDWLHERSVDAEGKR